MALGLSFAEASPAVTVIGFAIADRARAADSSAEACETIGGTFTTDPAMGSRSFSNASTSCAEVASTSSARPFLPGLSSAVMSLMVMLGSVAGRSMASDIPETWLVSACSSTTTTGSTSLCPSRSATMTKGLNVRPVALATVAFASNERPASLGFTTNSLPTASTLIGRRDSLPRVASRVATASAVLIPPIDTPLTTVPCLTPPPESTMRAT